MAIWEAIVGSEKRRLDDDGALYLLQVFGVGLPPARRLKVRSPQQHGSMDIGYRYDEREMRLAFYFNALNPAGAVAKRDELYGFWKALEATPVQIRYTRDDASVRQIDCYVTGVVDMPWDPDRNQMGQQDFIVQVEAANPMWYNPTQAVLSFSENDALDWWYALGTIDGGNIKTYVESPGQAQGFGGSGISNGQPWTIYFRTTATASPGGQETAFNIQEPPYILWADVSSGTNRLTFNYGGSLSGVFNLGGESDYIFSSDGSVITVYRDNMATPIGSLGAGGMGVSTASGTVWRSWGSPVLYPWTPSLPYAAIYNINLSQSQRESLVIAADGFYTTSKTITYNGSFAEYPIITIDGPITDPVLTNVSTGETLDFTGITISGGDSYTIDCRFGYKTVRNAAGTNKIADLTSDSDLATFHLGADPEVSDGANAFTLTGTGTDSNTQVTVAYYERYVGA